ncbi:MAG: 23S rRNA (uracil(1939)-C(5))-methyltransferase RlmD [Angelakisella sp.]
MDQIIPKPQNENSAIPTCKHAKKCGGCQMQNMPYPQQLRWKQIKVERLLEKFQKVSPILGMKNPLHYRNKVQAAFGIDMRKRIVSGVYQSSSHRIVPVDSCMIEDQKADEIIVTIRGMLTEFKLLPYNEDTGRGFLRHVLVKRGFASGEIMVVLVTGSSHFPSKNNFIQVLRDRHPDITTSVQNVNAGNTSLVLGEQQKVLFGSGYIEDTLCGCVFRISPKSFYQINPIQTEVLYGRAIELAGLSGHERVIDAYCGIGTIGLIASSHCKEVMGIELNRDAVKDAISNCRRNQITNARFYTGDAGEFMTAMAAENETADVVFMDPPRAGSDEAFLSSVLKLAPKKVVYISCNPETLARDLEVLTAGGYRTKSIQPVDMFPYTHHVEAIILMTYCGDKPKN